MICKGLNGAEVALLPISACANVESLEEVDRNTRWINNMVTLISRKGMSKTDAINCLHARLRIMTPPLIIEQRPAIASSNVS